VHFSCTNFHQKQLYRIPSEILYTAPIVVRLLGVTGGVRRFRVRVLYITVVESLHIYRVRVGFELGVRNWV
jgi:hypothetical protein